MINPELKKALLKVASFYDEKKVGDLGPLGFRRSTDLRRLIQCIETIIEWDYVKFQDSLFLDMGCADGRVNVMLSYLVQKSVGIELDEWTLDEYGPLKGQLIKQLKEEKLTLPQGNIFLFHGDAMDERVINDVQQATGNPLEDFDLFYTYLTMQEEFADMIARRAKKGALFMVYGLESILPKYEGLRLLTPERPLEGILALYQKI